MKCKSCQIKKLYLPLLYEKIRTYGGYSQTFMQALDENVQRKIDYALQLLKTQERLSVKFVKVIKDGLFELRIEYESNIYRVFFIFDNGQVVVLFNGFQKKSRKTPKQEIEKALKIKKAYYADK